MSARKILAIDDTEMGRLLLSEFLSTLGHDVVLAGTGKAGVDTFAHTQCDLAFVDLSLPDISGSQVAEMMRAIEREERRPEIPIIAVSATTSLSALENAFLRGVTGFLEKPLNMNRLEQVLHHHLKSDEMMFLPADGLPFRTKPSIFSADELLARNLKNSRVVLQILSCFANQLAESLEGISQALAQQNSDRVCHHAHALRGASRVVGAHSISNLASDLEAAATSSRLEHAESLFNTLRREIAACQALVATVRQETSRSNRLFE